METLDEVMSALQKADAAGNTEDAKQLAQMARELSAAPSSEPESKPTPAESWGGEVPAATKEDRASQESAFVASQPPEKTRDFSTPSKAVGSAMQIAGEHMVGAVDSAATLATGIPMSMVGNAYGMLHGGAEDAAKVASDWTWQPRSEAGKAQIKFLGDVAGALPPVGLPRLPAGSVAQTARLGLRKVAPEMAANLQQMEVSAAANRARIAALDAPVQEGRRGAQAAGYIVPDGSGSVGEIVTGVSGEPRFQKLASKKNAAVTNELGARDVGLNPNQPITRDAVAEVRRKAGEKYNALRSVGKFENNAEYFKALDDVEKGYISAGESYPGVANPLSDTLTSLRVQSANTGSAIDMMSILRDKAKKAYVEGAGREGKAYRDMAAAIDDSMESAIQAKGKALVGRGEFGSAKRQYMDMVENYRDAKKLIAKTYLLDSALNETTGNVNTMKYAQQLAKQKPLDGAALQIAKFGRQFPNLARDPGRIGSVSATFHDFAVAMLSHGSIGQKVLTAAARPVARSILASRAYQDFMKNPEESGAAKSSMRSRVSSMLNEFETPSGAAAAGNVAKQEENARPQ